MVAEDLETSRSPGERLGGGLELSLVALPRAQGELFTSGGNFRGQIEIRFWVMNSGRAASARVRAVLLALIVLGARVRVNVDAEACQDRGGMALSAA